MVCGGLSDPQVREEHGDRPQYFVEDDHDLIVPKAVFYQVQGEKKRRSGLAKDPSKLRFGNSLPEWMAREAQPQGEGTGACRDYDDFFNRTRYTVPEGVLDENGRMERFNNDLVIRYLDRVVVKEDGYEVEFKAGVKVQVEV